MRLSRLAPAVHKFDWPTAPNRLPGRLRRSAIFLRQIGIKIDFGREGKTGARTLFITREEKPGSSSSANPL
jgi:hypothetical protein